MLNIHHLFEAWRIFKRSIYVKIYGTKKYEGNAKEICENIVKDCWNGKYFQVSKGHFCEFYIRDFGLCIDSLLKLGYEKEVKKTLEYALQHYSNQKLTTTITPSGKCIDIFKYSPDSLAFLIRSLRVSKSNNLIKKYKEFLIKEIDKCFNLCFNKNESLIRSDKYFGSMKDESCRKSSTYDNIIIAMLSEELNKLKFYNPFKNYDIKNKIKNRLWSGEFFFDDINRKKIITGDSNIFPFWTGVFNDKKMMMKSINSIKKVKLDSPFPLKYSTSRFKEHKMYFVELFVLDYERDSLWMHMGPLYVSLVKNIDKDLFKKYVKSYTNIIEKNKNFLEVFDSRGNPFKSIFYYSDESMLWAANYLSLLKK